MSGAKEFVAFADLPDGEQERVARAERPRVHVEPVILHRRGSAETMPSIHLQIGDAHALLLTADIKQFHDVMREAMLMLKLKAHYGEEQQ